MVRAKKRYKVLVLFGSAGTPPADQDFTKELKTDDFAAEAHVIGALKQLGHEVRTLGIWDTRENQRITDNIALGIQMFLGIIGALTLFVGGMGVANIMYAVVKERTREIGVKMALGAKMRQVMAPFLLEALMMTVIGGLLGTAAALGLMGIISVLPLKGDAFDFLGRPTFSPAIAAATATVLGTIGMLAGYFPARRAASVNPAVSLRYE